MQLDITGFLDKKAGPFCAELWSLLVDAQSNPHGIPTKFIQQKREEIINREKAAANVIPVTIHNLPTSTVTSTASNPLSNPPFQTEKSYGLQQKEINIQISKDVINRHDSLDTSSAKSPGVPNYVDNRDVVGTLERQRNFGGVDADRINRDRELISTDLRDDNYSHRREDYVDRSKDGKNGNSSNNYRNETDRNSRRLDNNNNERYRAADADQDRIRDRRNSRNEETSRGTVEARGVSRGDMERLRDRRDSRDEEAHRRTADFLEGSRGDRERVRSRRDGRDEEAPRRIAESRGDEFGRRESDRKYIDRPRGWERDRDSDSYRGREREQTVGTSSNASKESRSGHHFSLGRHDETDTSDHASPRLNRESKYRDDDSHTSHTDRRRHDVIDSHLRDVHTKSTSSVIEFDSAAELQRTTLKHSTRPHDDDDSIDENSAKRKNIRSNDRDSVYSNSLHGNDKIIEIKERDDHEISHERENIHHDRRVKKEKKEKKQKKEKKHKNEKKSKHSSRRSSVSEGDEDDRKHADGHDAEIGNRRRDSYDEDCGDNDNIHVDREASRDTNTSTSMLVDDNSYGANHESFSSSTSAVAATNSHAKDTKAEEMKLRELALKSILAKRRKEAELKSN